VNPLPAQSPTFEAASIKLNKSGRPGGGISLYPARIKIVNSSLEFCVQMAFDVKYFQVAGGASWMDTEHYDIDAVAAAPFTQGESRVMLQALLADRFGLEIHREMRDKPGYVLVAAKGGAKLSPPIDDPSVMFSRTSTGDVTLKAPNVSMDRLASALSTTLGSIVVDKTGIDGKFNVSLQWTPDQGTQPRASKSAVMPPPPPSDTVPGPSLFTALEEKLGLKLESRKVPVEVIVIDRANRPSEN
jgi:uncharacterized protein (TIGR03435 family)